MPATHYSEESSTDDEEQQPIQNKKYLKKAITYKKEKKWTNYEYLYYRHLKHFNICNLLLYILWLICFWS